MVKPFLLKSKHEKSKESYGFESTSTTVTALLDWGAFLLYNTLIHIIPMTYEATVQLKFDATYTPTYGSGFGSTVIDDFIPEEHFLITAPAQDLNAKQYFKLFEKFMLCVGMTPAAIRSGAMSLVFNEFVREEEQRKVCKEYELTMDEDLRSKFEEFKEADEAWANLKKGPMGTVIEED